MARFVLQSIAGTPAAYPEWLERRWVFLVSFLTAVAICGALIVA